MRAVFSGPIGVVVSSVIPSGHLTENIDLHLIDENPIGCRHFIADIFMYVFK